MGPKTSNFQVIILIAFGFFLFVGVILFATAKISPKKGGVTITPVIMWGTVSKEVMNGFFETILEKEKDSLEITYVQKDSKTFEKDLIEAIADSAGPDIVILPQDMIVKNINKFSVIPYSSYSLRTFKDQFIDASSVYLNQEGIIALPFIVDPLVMYWNKTHFVNAGIVSPPTKWDEFTQTVLKLTKKDSNFNVTQSGTALGEYQNVDHAKYILSTLFLQAGIPIIAKNKAGEYESFLSPNNANSENGAVSALSFYTDFANPSKDVYLWNKSLKPSFSSFLSGDTSIYFGFASELSSIPLKNPNLNFDIAKVPQASGDFKKSVFAKMYGLAILKTSKSQVSAYNQVIQLISKDSIELLSTLSNLPPVRKDVLSNNPSDIYMKAFYDSALIADTFPDIDGTATSLIYKDMIESVIIGKNNPSQAVSKANNEITNIINQTLKIK